MFCVPVPLQLAYVLDVFFFPFSCSLRDLFLILLIVFFLSPFNFFKIFFSPLLFCFTDLNSMFLSIYFTGTLFRTIDLMRSFRMSRKKLFAHRTLLFNSWHRRGCYLLTPSSYHTDYFNVRLYSSTANHSFVADGPNNFSILSFIHVAVIA